MSLPRCFELLNFALTQPVTKTIKRAQLILAKSIQQVRLSDLREHALLWLATQPAELTCSCSIQEDSWMRDALKTLGIVLLLAVVWPVSMHAQAVLGTIAGG